MMSRIEDRDPLKEFMDGFPTSYANAKGHPKFHISSAGAKAIGNMITNLSKKTLFMFKQCLIPERLIMLGVFSQLNPMEFEILVRESLDKTNPEHENRKKQIHELVENAVILGVNTLTYSPDFKKTSDSLKNFYEATQSTKVRMNNRAKTVDEFYRIFLNAYQASLKGKDYSKLECGVDFAVLLETPDYVHPQVAKTSTQTGKKKESSQNEVQEDIKTISSETDAVTPKEFNINKVLQNIITDLLKTVSVFVILTFMSFVFGALNSNFGTFVTNPFFAMICLSSSIVLIMLTEGFNTFESEDY